jgi:hypothetical protein
MSNDYKSRSFFSFTFNWPWQPKQTSTTSVRFRHFTPSPSPWTDRHLQSIKPQPPIQRERQAIVGKQRRISIYMMCFVTHYRDFRTSPQAPRPPFLTKQTNPSSSHNARLRPSVGSNHNPLLPRHGLQQLSNLQGRADASRPAKAGGSAWNVSSVVSRSFFLLCSSLSSLFRDL